LRPNRQLRLEQTVGRAESGYLKNMSDARYRAEREGLGTGWHVTLAELADHYKLFAFDDWEAGGRSRSIGEIKAKLRLWISADQSVNGCPIWGSIRFPNKMSRCPVRGCFCAQRDCSGIS